MIDYAKAIKLTLNHTIYHVSARNADGSPERWRINGKVKLWKTRPGEFQIPIKWGLKTCGYLTQNNTDFFCLDEDEALGKSLQYRCLKAVWESDTDRIKEKMIATAEKAVNEKWDLHSEMAYTHMFNDGCFDPFDTDTKESQFYNAYTSDQGNEDDETELIGNYWIETLTNADKKKYKEIICIFKDIRDHGL